VGDLTQRRRTLILAICCMSLFIVGMDNTIVNVALPSIRLDLHTDLTDLQWIVDAYSVVLASLLMLSGSTADRFGRRRIFQIGLTVFTLSSLLCSLAPSLGWLVAFRALQAVGGSMLNPVALSIITNVFTERKERARAIGVWAGVIGLSFGVGPVVGGALIGWISWRSVFWINVPIGAAALVLTAVFVPESRASHARRLDPVGQLLVMVLLGGATFSIIEAPRAGWGSVQTVTAAVAAAVALLALLRYERRRVEPLVDLRLFRSAPFAGATLIAMCAFGAFSGFLFLITLYLQDVRNLSPFAAGVSLLPMAAMIAICAPISGRLVAGRGPRLPLVLAGACLTVGGLLLVPTSAHEPWLRLIPSMMIFAAGFGLVNAPITNTAISGMPRERAGVAAAIASTSRQVGGALGVAVIGSVLTSGMTGSAVTGFVPASHAAWWAVTGCGAAVLALGAATTGRWATTTADRTARLVAEEPALVDQLPLSRRHAGHVVRQPFRPS
jgi:EmrB/QacA subfamily drug resistance transporter